MKYIGGFMARTFQLSRTPVQVQASNDPVDQQEQYILSLIKSNNLVHLINS
jgi:hypothetical protein